MPSTTGNEDPYGPGYTFPLDPSITNHKDPRSPIFWAYHGISGARRDDNFRYYDEDNWRLLLDRYFPRATTPRHVRSWARRKMSACPGMLQLRTIPKGLDETRPLYPQVRPNEAIEEAHPTWGWHGSGEPPAFVQVGDMLFVPARYGKEGGYFNLINSDREHSHAHMSDAQRERHEEIDHRGEEELPEVDERHPHPEPIQGDIFFDVHLETWPSTKNHIKKASEVPGDLLPYVLNVPGYGRIELPRNFGGHDGQTLEGIPDVLQGIHPSFTRGKYQLPPNALELVTYNQGHDKMGPGQKKRHIELYHNGVDVEGSHPHQRWMEVRDPERRKLDSQAARLSCTLTQEEKLIELIDKFGFVIIMIEGFLKTTSLVDAGLPVLTTASVTTWDCAELERICRQIIRGHTVIIMPDGDWPLNSSVINATTLFKFALRRYGCSHVVVASTPLDWELCEELRQVLIENPFLTKISSDDREVTLSGKAVDDHRGIDPETGGPQSFTDLISISPELPFGMNEDSISQHIRDNMHLLKVPETIYEVDKKGEPKLDKNGKPIVLVKARPNGLYESGVRHLTNAVLALSEFAAYRGGQVRLSATAFGSVVAPELKQPRNKVPQVLRDLHTLGYIDVETSVLDRPLKKDRFGSWNFAGGTQLITVREPYRATLQTPARLGDLFPTIGLYEIPLHYDFDYTPPGPCHP